MLSQTMLCSQNIVKVKRRLTICYDLILMVRRTARDIVKNTHPNSDVQLVFVGEENTNGSLLLYRGGHDVLCGLMISTFSLLKCLSVLLLSVPFFTLLSVPGRFVHIAPEKTDDMRVK